MLSVCLNVSMQTHMYADVHTHVYRRVYADVQPHAYAHVETRVYTHVWACGISLHMPVHIRVNTPENISTHMSTHTSTHMSRRTSTHTTGIMAVGRTITVRRPTMYAVQPFFFLDHDSRIVETIFLLLNCPHYTLLHAGGWSQEAPF